MNENTPHLDNLDSLPCDYIPRALEPTVLRYSENFKVVLVTGPRQVGKTTMLKHLMLQESTHEANNRTYITLDSTPTRMLAKEDPELFFQRYQPPLLIDEIQKAPELLPAIKTIVDESNDNGAFWLTGSQPFHLIKEASESLAGRIGVIEMLGLSNAEIERRLSLPFEPSPDFFTTRIKECASHDVNEVYQRIFEGALPAVRQLPDDLQAGGWESYIDTYIMRDIHDLAHVEDELKFRNFISACAALTSKPIVYADLARLADIDQKTAKAWLSLLVSSYLVKIVKPYSNNLLKRLSKQPIMHFTDTGLAAHLAGWENARSLERGAMSGQIFETYVFNEIDKSFVNAGRSAPLSFFRNNDKKEIDLLIEQNGVLHPIEAKKSAAPKKNDTRNFSALDAVDAVDIPEDLAAFRREIGIGCIVCMSSDTFPVNDRAWAFPVWAI